jgi:hypothetical protein
MAAAYDVIAAGGSLFLLVHTQCLQLQRLRAFCVEIHLHMPVTMSGCATHISKVHTIGTCTVTRVSHTKLQWKPCPSMGAPICCIKDYRALARL